MHVTDSKLFYIEMLTVVAVDNDLMNDRVDKSIGHLAVSVETNALKFSRTQGEVVLTTLVILPRIEVRCYISA